MQRDFANLFDGFVSHSEMDAEQCHMAQKTPQMIARILDELKTKQCQMTH